MEFVTFSNYSGYLSSLAAQSVRVVLSDLLSRTGRSLLSYFWFHWLADFLQCVNRRTGNETWTVNGSNLKKKGVLKHQVNVSRHLWFLFIVLFLFF